MLPQAKGQKWHGVNYGNRFIPEDWMRQPGGGLLHVALYMAMVCAFLFVPLFPIMEVEQAFLQELVVQSPLVSFHDC